MSDVVDVKQDATGPLHKYGRWPRRTPVHHLTLGDIRALLAQIDKLGIPDERVVRALCAGHGVISQRVSCLETARVPPPVARGSGGGLILRRLPRGLLTTGTATQTATRARARTVDVNHGRIPRGIAGGSAARARWVGVSCRGQTCDYVRGLLATCPTISTNWRGGKA